MGAGVVRDVLGWWLEVLAGRDVLTESGYADRFDPRFVRAVPFEDFSAWLDHLSGEWIIEREVFDLRDDHRLWGVIKCGDDRRVRFTVAVSPEPPHVVRGLQTATMAPPSAIPTVPSQRSLPDTLAAGSLCWFLDALEGRVAIENELYEEMFTATFRAGVSRDAFESHVLGRAGLWTVLRSWTLDEVEGIVAVVASGDVALQVTVVRQSEAPHAISSLLFRPTSASPFGVTSLEQFGAELEAHVPRHAWLVAECDASTGQWRQRAGARVDAVMPLASVFKLYVLGALALGVEAGRLAWDEPVTVQDRLRNERQRGMGQLPAGEEVTVRQAAQWMIGISCNTATDHLLELVGREQVEKALTTLGHHRPEATTPFLYSREAFLLKWGPQQSIGQEYATATSARRRELLRALADSPLVFSELDRTEAPRFIDTVEWLASANDIQRALTWLVDHSPEVAEILAVTPGLRPQDVSAWSYAAFKGGGEPGVKTGAWYRRDHAGNAKVVVLILNDPTSPIDAGLWLDIADAAMNQLT